jgi:hypothetical protein
MKFAPKEASAFSVFSAKGKRPLPITETLQKRQVQKHRDSPVRSIMSSLFVAMKALSLYEEGHSHCQRTLTQFHEELEGFLNRWEALVLAVSERELIYLGEVVYQGKGKDGELAFSLFRDGITSLRFTQGIEFEETQTFVKILNRYKTLPTSAEGDIVTALWELEIPHIEYDAVDNILEADGLGESGDIKQDWLGALSPGGVESFSLGELKKAVQDPPLKESRRRLPKLTEPAALEVTLEEAHQIEDMVRSEERRDATQEILEMLTDALKVHQGEDFFSHALDYMLDELRKAFSIKDFSVALKILKTLNHVYKLCREAGPWAAPKVREFLLRISKPDFLEGLRNGWGEVPEEQMSQAKQVLVFLPPDSIPHLCAMLNEAPAFVRLILVEVILVLAARDIRPFLKMLDDADENLLMVFMPFLANLKGEASAQIFLRMIRSPSEQVRREALRAMIVGRIWVPQALAPLLDDESRFIRQLTVKYLGSRKSPDAQALLIDHLRRIKVSSSNGDEVIACFKALGKCGTAGSIPFLHEALLKGGFISRFRDSLTRRGAALALLALDSQHSKDVLNKASRSLFPSVRNAARTVYKEDGEF